MQASSSAPALSLRPRLWHWVAAVLLLGAGSGCATLPPNTQRVASTALVQPEQTALGRLMEERRAQDHARSDSGFHLLEGADEALEARLALIDEAQRTLDLQYYAIHADASTEVLLQHVREAARRGVRVRVLLDDFNSVGEDAQVLRLAFEPNVQMRLFNPLPGSRQNMMGRVMNAMRDLRQLQKRMHNKQFIADNTWGIIGGRNLGDTYFGSGTKQNYIDLDVLAAGRVVHDMSASFDHYWNDELAYPVQTLLDPQDLDRLRKPQAAAAARPEQSPQSPQSPQVPPAPSLPVTVSPTVLPSVTPTAVINAEKPPLDLRTIALTWAPSVLLADKPGKVGPDDDEANAGDTVVDGLLALMRGAQSDILIVSPYFVPGPRMMAVYQELRRRGVRIRVLTNSMASNDAPAAQAGYARYRKALLDLGIELYEMRAAPDTAAELLGSSSSQPAAERGGDFLGSGPGGSKSGASRASLHLKAIVIDQHLSVIGSMNLDLRSELKNSEVGLLVRSHKLAQQLTGEVEKTLGSAAYRLERQGGHFVWRAPPGAAFHDETTEPGASVRTRLMVRLLGPFAPDEML